MNREDESLWQETLAAATALREHGSASEPPQESRVTRQAETLAIPRRRRDVRFRSVGNGLQHRIRLYRSHCGKDAEAVAAAMMLSVMREFPPLQEGVPPSTVEELIESLQTLVAAGAIREHGRHG